jgi:hypothetical protein
MAVPPINDEDKPLDPAVERVRRRLLRFMIINLGILFAAFAVVIGAFVYKSASLAPKAARDQGRAAALPHGPEIAATITLPAGAKLVSQSLSGDRALLEVELPDGQRSLLFYDLASGQAIGRYAIEAR